MYIFEDLGKRAMAFFPEDELRRKSFHLMTLVYVFGYWFLPRQSVLFLMGVATLTAVLMEILRLNFPSFNDWLLNTMGGVHRPEESNKVSGLPFTLSGSFLTMFFFEDKRIVMTSLLYLTFGDTLAALVGRRVGRNRILNGSKTVEGSLACFLVCLFLGLFLLNWHIALAGALLATLIELAPWPLNDNFWVPLVSAASLTLFTTLI